MKTAAILEPRASVALGDYVVDCAWSSDARRLAVACSEGKVQLLEFDERESRAHELGEHLLGALAVAWQPGTALFASAGQDGAVVLWDAQAHAESMRLRPGRGPAAAIAFAPGGRWLACASGRTLSLWTPAGERLHEFEPAAGAISALAWDRTGRELAAATNGGMLVHRIEPPRFATRHLKWAAACLTAALSPDGKVLATGTQDGSVHFWHLASGRDAQMRGYGAKVQLTAWSANSRYLATSAGSEVIVWDFAGRGPEGSRPLQLTGHTERIGALDFHPSGPWLATGGRDWRLSLWLPGKATQALDAHLASEEITAVRFSPDGRFLAAGERGGQLVLYALRQLPR